MKFNKYVCLKGNNDYLVRYKYFLLNVTIISTIAWI